MTDEEKILAMFRLVHGEPTGACSTQVTHDENGNVDGVSLMKHGYEAWHAHRDMLVFQCLQLPQLPEVQG